MTKGSLDRADPCRSVLMNNAPLRPLGPRHLRMQIGFSINEMLFLATLVTGAAWIAWRFKLRRLGAEPAKKP